MTRKLDQSIRALRGDSPKKSVLLSGFLGVIIAGKKKVKVADRDGFVYVRINNNLNNLVQAFNTAVAPVYDLPVFVEFKNGQYRVLGRDVDRYAGSTGNEASYLPAHGPTHSFAGRNTIAGGGDPVWVYQEQFLPLLGIPSGTDCAACILIGPHLYNWFGTWKYAGYTGSPSITSYLPTGSNSAKMLLLYIEGSSGNPKFVAGSEFSYLISGSSDIIPYLPTISPTVGIPLAGVRLVTGATVIDWPNLYDVRQFFGREMAPSGTTGGGGGGAIAVQDEGTFIGSGTVLNFVGAGVTASASGTDIRVYVPTTVSGTPGGGTPLIIEDEGAFLVTGTDLNFVGSGVTVTASGTQARVYIPTPTPTPPLIVQDEGAYLVTGSSMNFVGEGVTASASGTQAQILIPITPRIIVEDEGAYLVTGTHLNFVGDGVTVTASGTKARIYIPAGSGSSGGGGGIGFVAQDEGGFLVTGTVLNFVGAGVTATASGTDVRVYIPFATGSASQMGVGVQDEASFLVTGTMLNFVGEGVTASASGTNVRVAVPITPRILVYDEGGFLVTGSILNFVGEGVVATASGTQARVFVPITPRLLIYDEGAYLVTGTTIDFVGDGVTATASGTQARVFIPITPRLLVYDEGAFLATGSSLNFVGDGVTSTASGSQIRVYIPGSSGGGGGGGMGFVAQDEGAYLATGTTLNFVGVGVTATASGTNVRVYIPGASGFGNSLGEPTSPYLGTVPALSSFTWDNSGTCIAVEPATGGIRMSHAPNANNECYVLYKSLAQASHYRITINFIPTGWDNYNRMGIALRESSSGKILGCNLMYHNALPWVCAHKWNTTTSWDGNYIEVGTLPDVPHWLQIEDDGTNLIWRFSYDGTYFIDYCSELRGDFMTANQCGLLLENENGITWQTVAMWVRSWLEQAI